MIGCLGLPWFDNKSKAGVGSGEKRIGKDTRGREEGRKEPAEETHRG